MADDSENYEWVTDAVEEEQDQDESKQNEVSNSSGYESEEQITKESADLAGATKDQLEELSASPNVNELRSLKKELAHEQSNISDLITPIIEQAITSADEAAEKENELEQLRSEVEGLIDACNSQTENQFTGNYSQKISQLSAQINNNEILLRNSSELVSNVAADVEKKNQLKTERSRKFIQNLIKPEDSDVHAELISTVQDLDEVHMMNQSLGDISTREIQRRLDSVENDLSTRDTPLAQHLSERLNEFRQTINSRDLNQIQKYSIYQEVAYYDRTLLPRLSR